MSNRSGRKRRGRSSDNGTATAATLAAGAAICYGLFGGVWKPLLQLIAIPLVMYAAGAGLKAVDMLTEQSNA